MRYSLLIYQNARAWNGLSQEGKHVFMHAAGDRVVTVTDGPFLEAKEALAGYCIVDVATPERADEIAARWPDAQHWGMEIRALMHGGGEEG
jgi:YCII-related domain-containing protein